MKRCIAIAQKGSGHVSPNPLVGAVIFDDNLDRYRKLQTLHHKKEELIKLKSLSKILILMLLNLQVHQELVKQH